MTIFDEAEKMVPTIEVFISDYIQNGSGWTVYQLLEARDELIGYYYWAGHFYAACIKQEAEAESLYDVKKAESYMTHRATTTDKNSDKLCRIDAEPYSVEANNARYHTKRSMGLRDSISRTLDSMQQRISVERSEMRT
jgi:hypothetical protein